METSFSLSDSFLPTTLPLSMGEQMFVGRKVIVYISEKLVDKSLKYIVQTLFSPKVLLPILSHPIGGIATSALLVWLLSVAIKSTGQFLKIFDTRRATREPVLLPEFFNFMRRMQWFRTTATSKTKKLPSRYHLNCISYGISSVVGKLFELISTWFSWSRNCSCCWCCYFFCHTITKQFQAKPPPIIK